MQGRFTKEEVLDASLAYFKGDELAASTFVTKYALKDPKNGLFSELTPDDMHRRMAQEIARIEESTGDGTKS
jgi:ribonucleoside-diphosphate reductase alpha chain